MARERHNRRTAKPRKQDKLIRQGMVTHESRYPTLEELRATVRGIEDQSNHFDSDFGVTADLRDERWDYEC